MFPIKVFACTVACGVVANVILHNKTNFATPFYYNQIKRDHGFVFEIPKWYEYEADSIISQEPLIQEIIDNLNDNKFVLNTQIAMLLRTAIERNMNNGITKLNIPISVFHEIIKYHPDIIQIIPMEYYDIDEYIKIAKGDCENIKYFSYNLLSASYGQLESYIVTENPAISATVAKIIFKEAREKAYHKNYYINIDLLQKLIDSNPKILKYMDKDNIFVNKNARQDFIIENLKTNPFNIKYIKTSLLDRLMCDKLCKLYDNNIKKLLCDCPAVMLYLPVIDVDLSDIEKLIITKYPHYIESLSVQWREKLHVSE